MQNYWRKSGFGSHGLITRGLVGDETDALDLPQFVEANDPNEVVWVGLLALLHLKQHLGRVHAPIHG